MKVTTRQRSALFTAKNFVVALKETKNAFFNGTPGQLAAGVAYYGTLSFFPLVAAMVAIASMTLSADQVVAIVTGFTKYLPADIASLFSTQLQNASAHQQANMVIMVFALGLSIFGVSGAMDSIIKAITTIYNVKDTRPFIVQKLLSICLTVGFIAGMTVVLPLLFIGSSLLMVWHVPMMIITLYDAVRWIILLAIAVTGIGVVYHFALPGRRVWRWFSWGSIVATALWLISTAILFIYLQNFANFSNSYSLFAGIIALMMWINFSALALLIGADVNKSFEQRRSK